MTGMKNSRHSRRTGTGNSSQAHALDFGDVQAEQRAGASRSAVSLITHAI